MTIGMTELFEHPPHDVDAILRPEFEKAGKVHDWRNHVPAKIRSLWPLLSIETRLVAYYMAEERASNEQWD